MVSNGCEHMGQRCSSNNPWHFSHRARWPHGTSEYVLPFDLYITHTFGEFRYNNGNMVGTGANVKLLSARFFLALSFLYIPIEEDSGITQSS